MCRAESEQRYGTPDEYSSLVLTRSAASEETTAPELTAAALAKYGESAKTEPAFVDRRNALSALYVRLEEINREYCEVQDEICEEERCLEEDIKAWCVQRMSEEAKTVTEACAEQPTRPSRGCH